VYILNDDENQKLWVVIGSEKTHLPELDAALSRLAIERFSHRLPAPRREKRAPKCERRVNRVLETATP
jgi:hypothetical protein